jgi:arsenite methyltransferase
MLSETETRATASSETERAVRDRYSAAATTHEAVLCCPIDYDAQHLRIIPDEVIKRDYGCGDPSRYVREGDAVLDLGSGGGKICFIASQLVGPNGRVLGIDANDEMLELARRSSPAVADALGYANVKFLRGQIQDLSLDHDELGEWLARNPIKDIEGLQQLEAEKDRLRRCVPMVADRSVDIVVSNCVLNLVHEDHKPQLIREIYRVLKRGGRIAISDIVSDEVVPEELRADPELWSGCISGAFHESELLRELESVGFHGITIDKWEHEPFAVVDGIEFRSITVTATKGKEGPCWEGNRTVIYRGPWKSVEDDDGHTMKRGQRVAVCDKTYEILTSGPYAKETVGILPRVCIPDANRERFDCTRTRTREPSESKGEDYHETREAGATGSCC